MESYNEHESIQAFLAGYQAVKNGWIMRELTRREIETYYHEHRNNSTAFHNGMIDALANDSYRYDLTLEQCRQRLSA